MIPFVGVIDFFWGLGVLYITLAVYDFHSPGLERFGFMNTLCSDLLYRKNISIDCSEIMQFIMDSTALDWLLMINLSFFFFILSFISFEFSAIG